MSMRDMKKEFKNGLRTGKFLILAAAFLFFALSTPVMTKILLPEIFKSQFPNIAPDAMRQIVDISQTGSLQSYMGDVFEIGTIIVVFTLCGIMGQELKENTLVLPVCSGKSYLGIVTSKMIVFGAALLLIMTAALAADYAYAGILMGFEVPSVLPVLRAGLLEGLYMVFILSCLVMFGVFIKKPVAAGVLTLIVAYGSHFIGGALRITQYMPSGMLAEANLLAEPPATLIIAILITVSVTILFSGISVWRFKNMELNVR